MTDSSQPPPPPPASPLAPPAAAAPSPVPAPATPAAPAHAAAVPEAVAVAAAHLPVTHRRAPVVCIVLTALILFTTLAGHHAFFSTLDLVVPGATTGVVYPQIAFDNGWKAAQHQATLASGGLSLEALGRDHQLWRLLTVNLASRECQHFYPSQPMPWLIAIFVLIFIWLNINIYEIILGSLRTAGLLLAVGLGSGIVASFYQAGFAYPGLLPFFPAVSLAFLFGSFRWKQANLHAGDLYFAPLDLLVLAIQVFLCYWFLAEFAFVMIPAIAGGIIAGSLYMYCVPPGKAHRTEGVRFHPKLWWAVGTLCALLLIGIVWSAVDNHADYQTPVLRMKRLGFGPQDQIVIGYDEKGGIHIATGGGSTLAGGYPVGSPVPPPPATGPSNPPGTPQPGSPTGPGPLPGPPAPGTPPTPPTPVGPTVDPVLQQAVFDFDTRTARPYFVARMEAYTQLKVAGWPTEMQLVAKELDLAAGLKAALQPVADFKSAQPDLQDYAAAIAAEAQAYAAWLDLIAQAGDDNLVTRTGIQAALKKALDLTDRRRKAYLALANTYAIRTVSADLQIGVPLFKPTTVYRRAEEFRLLYDSKIGVADQEINTWLGRLETYRQTPVEMKKWIETKKYIEQLTELRAAVEKFQAQDPQIRDYHQAFLAEAKGLIDYFEFVRANAVDNEGPTWRGIANQYDKWLGLQARRRALETTLLERFNFTNE